MYKIFDAREVTIKSEQRLKNNLVISSLFGI